MLIRKAKLEDLESLGVLFDAYRKFYGKQGDIIGAGIFIKERLKNNDSEIFVATNEEDGALMGFVQLYPLFSSTRMKRLWLLNDLFIDAGFRGKGISVALINECKNLCNRTASCGMILETAKDNIIANNLYLKTGFLPDNEHNFYEWG